MKTGTTDNGIADAGVAQALFSPQRLVFAIWLISGPSYYSITIIRSAQNSIGNYLGPCTSIAIPCGSELDGCGLIGATHPAVAVRLLVTVQLMTRR